MFIPHPPIKKKVNETVRLSIPTRLMDTVRAMAQQVNGEPSDVLCQALEYALSDSDVRKKRSKKPTASNDGNPEVVESGGRPKAPSEATSQLMMSPAKPTKG